MATLSVLNWPDCYSIGAVSGILTVLEIIVPTPAAFTISSLEITPEEVDIGENVNVSVRVDNTGESEGVYQVVCKVDGVVVDEKEITLAGGSGESVVFTTTFDEAGIQTIEVNGLTGSLIIKGDTSPPEHIPLPAEENPDIPSGEVAGLSDPDVIEESSSTSELTPRLVGGILGGCLLAAIFVYVIWWRRRSISKNST